MSVTKNNILQHKTRYYFQPRSCSQTRMQSKPITSVRAEQFVGVIRHMSSVVAECQLPDCKPDGYCTKRQKKPNNRTHTVRMTTKHQSTEPRLRPTGPMWPKWQHFNTRQTAACCTVVMHSHLTLLA